MSPARGGIRSRGEPGAVVKSSLMLGGISTSVEGCRSSEVQLRGETWRKWYLFGKYLLAGASKDVSREARHVPGRTRPHERCVK